MNVVEIIDDPSVIETNTYIITTNLKSPDNSTDYNIWTTYPAWFHDNVIEPIDIPGTTSTSMYIGSISIVSGTTYDLSVTCTKNDNFGVRSKMAIGLYTQNIWSDRSNDVGTVVIPFTAAANDVGKAIYIIVVTGFPNNSVIISDVRITETTVDRAYLNDTRNKLVALEDIEYYKDFYCNTSTILCNDTSILCNGLTYLTVIGSSTVGIKDNNIMVPINDDAIMVAI